MTGPFVADELPHLAWRFEWEDHRAKLTGGKRPPKQSQDFATAAEAEKFKALLLASNPHVAASGRAAEAATEGEARGGEAMNLHRNKARRLRDEIAALLADADRADKVSNAHAIATAAKALLEAEVDAEVLLSLQVTP